MAPKKNPKADALESMVGKKITDGPTRKLKVKSEGKGMGFDTHLTMSGSAKYPRVAKLTGYEKTKGRKPFKIDGDDIPW
jgi:hypothetical protein